MLSALKERGGACLWLVWALTVAPAAGQPNWRLVRPDNTGIPGEEVRVVRFAPDARMWVLARWPFWRQGGIGIYDLDQRRWTTYGTIDYPIPSEYLNDVAFEPTGVAWIATENGLVRFDGSTWTIYQVGNAPFLHNQIMNVAAAPNGHIWVNNSNVQTVNGAIFEFDGVNWRRYAVPTELPWQEPWRSLSDVYVSRDGHVWVANQVLNGLAEYDGQTWRLHGAEVDRFEGIMEDRDGNIWMRAGVGGWDAFYKFDRATRTFTMHPEPTTPTAAAVDDDGAIYLGNWNGRIRVSRDGGLSWRDFTVQNAQIFNIAPDPRSTDVWVGTPGAVRRLDAQGNWLEAWNTYNTGMPDYWIDAMHRARDGKICFVSAEAGVSSYDDLRWFNLGSHNPNIFWPVLADGAASVYQDRNGHIWIGTNGVARWDGNTLQVWDWRNTPGFGVAMWEGGFAEDRSGTLFTLNEDGLVYRFTGTTWVRESLPPLGNPSGRIPPLKADRQGNVWAAGSFQIHRWDGAVWTRIDQNWPLFDLGGITVFDFDLSNVLWMGTNDGLLRWDGVQLTRYHVGNSPLPAKQVAGIAFRSDGVMALSTLEFRSQVPFPNGVAVIRGDINNPANWSIYRYGETPLPHYQLGPVEFDRHGHLWISALSEATAVLEIGWRAGDLNRDGRVNQIDLGILLADWGCNRGPGNCPGDADGDGDTDQADLGILLANWEG